MKKILLIASFVLVVFFSANAQVDLKGGWTYAFDPEWGGLNLGGIYGVSGDIDIAAGITLFFPEDFAGVDQDYWMVDFDGHFNFYPSKGLKLYPLAGLNFTTYKLGNNGDTEFGLNLGGGASFKLADRLRAYMELKYIIGDADQGVLGLGIAYRMN